MLASTQSARRRLFGSASILVSLFYAAALGLLAAAAAFPPAPGLHHLAVDGAMASIVFDHFWGVEQNNTAVWRWSKDRSTIHFVDYREYSGIVLSMPLTAPQYPNAPSTAITFATDVQSPFTLSIAPSWRTYHVLLMPEGWIWMHPGLQLTGVSASSGTADRRALGVAVGGVRIRPAGERLWAPAALRCATVVVLALLSHAWLCLWLPSLWSMVASLGIALIPAAAWHLAPEITAAQPAFWDLALIAGAGFSGLCLITSAIRREQFVRYRKRAFMWLFGSLGLLLLLAMAFSLRWRLGFDAANMIYLGWLVEQQGLTPYRDVVTQNMPGTYLLSAAIGKLFGYSDIGLRLADQTLLVILLAGTFVALRPLGTPVGWAAAVVFGLLYLRSGMYMALQREFLMLVPIGLALAVARIWHPAASSRFYLSIAAISVLFGLAATVKPHAIIGLPIVAGWYAWIHWTPHVQRNNPRVFIVTGVAVLAGVALPLIAVIVYLWSSGAWPAFLDIAINYWPLYNRLDRVHQTIDAASYPLYVWNNWIDLGGHHIWLITALIGAVSALRDQTLAHNHRMFVQMLVALTIGYSLYPIPAGKFWSYHWLPMLFFLVLLTALSFRSLERPGWFHQVILLIVGAVIVGAARPAPELHLFGGPPTGRKFQRTDRIVAFLRKQVLPNEQVQTLDWTGGANYAMLIARIEPATSFVEDFVLYHHVSHPTIQRFRKRFIDEFDASRPRFVIQITDEDKPWVSGFDTTRSFPELEQRLAREYRSILFGDGFIIYERRP